jgi:histidyl-tRNA synthetase
MSRPQIIQPKTPTGTMELLPREQAVFQNMLDVIRRSYERHGFQPIETPVFEEVNILLTKSGGETEKQVYFVQSTGSLAQGNKPDLALRFDLTVPLARYVAQHEHELAFPFRRYQIQRVYRGERAQKGRFREFYQCDIDIIGKDTLSPAYDAEVPVIIADIFRELQIGAFTINVSNRKILSGFLENYSIRNPERKATILREIDKLDKIGWNEVERNLLSNGNIEPDPEHAVAEGMFDNKPRLIDVIKEIINPEFLKSSNEEILKTCKERMRYAPEALKGLDEIELLLSMANDMGAGDVIKFNPAITRGLDYYTGTVYETFLDDHRDFGSICSGGRYDDLASFYTKSKLPGVGISIGVTRLFDQMRAADMIKGGDSTVQILVCMLDESLQPDLRKIATTLRKAGINTQLWVQADKMEKQIKYADRTGIPYLLVMGGDEKAKGVAALKNLKTREQKEIPLSNLADEVKKLIG